MHKFKYINSLGRPYDNSANKYTTIRFDISRYGSHQKTLRFKTKVTEKKAIRYAEKYLSKPLSERYYNRIKEDLFHRYEWDQAKHIFNTRGDCLTDLKFLESVYEKAENLNIVCGS